MSASWDAIEKTAQILCVETMTALEIARLATQADDIEGVAFGITAFGSAFAALHLNRTSLMPSSVMSGIVRLSNFLAFTADGDASCRTTIDAGVAFILSALTSVPRDMLIQVVSKIPASVLLEGALCTVVQELQNSDLDQWYRLLIVEGAITAIASGSLPKAIEAMKKAGFENKDFMGLLTVNGALTAMASGSLPKALEAMKKAGFENKDFMGLLTVDGALTAMASGSLILATETLRREGVHGNLWSMVLRRDGIISHLASGDFSIVTSRLDSLGLHQSGSDPIYSSTAFWQSIPFLLSDLFFTCQQELGIVTEGEEKNDTDRKRQAICCQRWRAAIREKRFLDARSILVSKRARVVTREPKTRKVVTRKTRKMATFEKEITSQLFSICQDHSKWSSTGAVLAKIEGSPIGIVWRESGYDRTSLTNFIHRLKQKRTKEALLATRGNATVKDVRSKALEMKTKT